METKANRFWDYFYADDYKPLNPDKSGKWMYFFEDWHAAYKLVKRAVEEGHVKTAKLTSEKVLEARDSGVACFYLEIDDTKGHKKILKYLIENNMVRRTKAHKLYNISFKLDNQTRLKEYGDTFKSELKLFDLIDKETEQWKV